MGAVREMLRGNKMNTGVISEFIDSLPSIPWLRPDGAPLPEWNISSAYPRDDKEDDYHLRHSYPSEWNNTPGWDDARENADKSLWASLKDFVDSNFQHSDDDPWRMQAIQSETDAWNKFVNQGISDATFHISEACIGLESKVNIVYSVCYSAFNACWNATKSVQWNHRKNMPIPGGWAVYRLTSWYEDGAFERELGENELSHSFFLPCLWASLLSLPGVITWIAVRFAADEMMFTHRCVFCRTEAWRIAGEAAEDAESMVEALFVQERIEEKHLKAIHGRWMAWRKGYVPLYDLFGTLYVYALAPEEAPGVL